MDKYRFEESNSSHPGICIMQDGKSVQATIPASTFMDKCNGMYRILNTESAFMSFVLTTFTERDEYNKFLDTIATLSAQSRGFLKMKQRQLPITLPDANYFMKRYEQIANDVENEKMDKLTGSTTLAKEFGEAMATSIRENNKVAKPYNIFPTNNATKNK